MSTILTSNFIYNVCLLTLFYPQVTPFSGSKEASNNMEYRQVICIGGGISGLSFAHQCQNNGYNVLLLEKSQRLGGCIETLQPHPDLLLEMGTHTFYRIYKQAYGLLSAHNKERYYPNPPFRHFIDSAKNQMPFWQKFDPVGLLKLPALLWERPQEKGLSAFFSAILGKKNVNNLFRPAFDALYCQPSDHYPAELLFKKRDRKTLSHLPKAFFLAEGMNALIADLGQQVECRFHQTVKSVHFENNQFFISLADEETPQYQCDILCIATPATEAMRLLTSLPLSSPLPHIHISAFNSLSLCYKTKTPHTEAGLIGWYSPFYSLIYGKRLPQCPPDIDGATFHFKDPNITPQEAIEISCRTLDINPHDILVTHQKRNALSALRPEHLPLIRSLSLPKPLALVGNYFDGFSIEDCVSRSNAEFQRIHHLTY